MNLYKINYNEFDYKPYYFGNQIPKTTNWIDNWNMNSEIILELVKDYIELFCRTKNTKYLDMANKLISLHHSLKQKEDREFSRKMEDIMKKCKTEQEQKMIDYQKEKKEHKDQSTQTYSENNELPVTNLNENIEPLVTIEDVDEEDQVIKNSDAIEILI